MSWKRLAFLVVGTLMLWYLGSFVLRIVWAAGGLDDGPGETGRRLELALLPIAATITWLVVRHLDR